MAGVKNFDEFWDGAVIGLVERVSFGPEERTREPLDRIHSPTQEFVQSERRTKLRFTRAARTYLRSEIGMNLCGDIFVSFIRSLVISDVSKPDVARSYVMLQGVL